MRKCLHKIVKCWGGTHFLPHWKWLVLMGTKPIPSLNIYWNTRLLYYKLLVCVRNWSLWINNKSLPNWTVNFLFYAGVIYRECLFPSVNVVAAWPQIDFFSNYPCGCVAATSKNPWKPLKPLILKKKLFFSSQWNKDITIYWQSNNISCILFLLTPVKQIKSRKTWPRCQAATRVSWQEFNLRLCSHAATRPRR